MSFKDDLEADLGVFYDSNEFAFKGLIKGREISLLFRKDIEIENIKEQVIRVRTFEVSDLSIGDKITINNKNYKCLHFKNDDDSQTTIVISEI